MISTATTKTIKWRTTKSIARKLNCIRKPAETVASTHRTDIKRILCSHLKLRLCTKRYRRKHERWNKINAPSFSHGPEYRVGDGETQVSLSNFVCHRSATAFNFTDAVRYARFERWNYAVCPVWLRAAAKCQCTYTYLIITYTRYMQRHSNKNKGSFRYALLVFTDVRCLFLTRSPIRPFARSLARSLLSSSMILLVSYRTHTNPPNRMCIVFFLSCADDTSQKHCSPASTHSSKQFSIRSCECVCLCVCGNRYAWNGRSEWSAFPSSFLSHSIHFISYSPYAFPVFLVAAAAVAASNDDFVSCLHFQYRNRCVREHHSHNETCVFLCVFISIASKYVQALNLPPMPKSIECVTAYSFISIWCWIYRYICVSARECVQRRLTGVQTCTCSVRHRPAFNLKKKRPLRSVHCNWFDFHPFASH